MKIDGDHNIEHLGKIAMLLRAAWSRRRAWHGEKVTLELRSELIKDGTELKIYIKAVDGDARGFDRVPGKSLTASKLDHEYTIDWKTFAYGERHEFVFDAIAKFDVEKNKVEAASPPLRVDLSPPVFSA
jgi:hypothetical protein